MANPSGAFGADQVGKPLSQLTSVEDLCRKVDALERHRTPLVRQWRINLAFYKGNQYVFFPPRSDRLESLITDDGLKPRHRVRLVSNQIMPGAHTLLAQLTKTKPQLHVSPGSGSENELRASQMAESLFNYWWQDLALDEKLDEALLWSIIGSAGYWKITWDPFAAKQMRITLGPDGNPITDETIKNAYTAELSKYGQEPEEKVIYMGDVKIDVLSPFQVYLDPGVPTFDESKFAICVHDLDPDEIRSRWGADVRPDRAPASPDSTLPFSGAAGTELSLRRVYIGYFKPTAAMPNGRYVVWTEGNDKKILADEKWPYPFNDLPLVKFAGMRVPGSVYDDAVVTHAIPLQKELNRTLSQIIEYKNLTINPVMIGPVGSLRTRRTTEPGQYLEYSPISVGGGVAKPEFQQLQTLPPYVFEHLTDINQRLQQIFLSSEVLNGKVPPNVEAGVAIDLLQEMATDRLAPIIKLLEASLAKAGQHMLALAQKYYMEPRLLRIQGSGGAVQVKQFVNADIAGNMTVRAETGSGLPRTRAGRQARIERMVELGLIDPRRAMRELDVADLQGIERRFRIDEELAYRNLDKIANGQPVNPESVQQAIQAVQQGVNPQTNEPIQSLQEAQQIVHNAGLQPMPTIDYDTHLDVTGDFINGIEFDSLQPAIRQDFLTYWSNILQTKLSLTPMPQPESPRTTLQIKSTAGPTATAKILERSGVQVTPDEMSEPPLETWVSDSVDKPDTDAAGPGQEAKNLSEAAKVELEAAQADAASKAQAVRDHQNHQLDQASKVDKASQDQQIHEQRLRAETAKADLAVRTAKEKKINQPAQPKKPKKAA